VQKLQRNTRSMKQVLVTAALGNVGREVVDQCARRGIAVRAADRDLARATGRFPDHDPTRLDFLARSTWRPALAGCDGLFLLRPPPIGDMKATLCPFVDAAYEEGVRHLVFLSVAGADRKRWVPHHEVERHLLKSGRSWTILRPGFFAQNLRDAYRPDVVEDDRLYVPAGGEAISFDGVAELLSGALGRRIGYRPASVLGYARHLRSHRRMPWMQIAIQAILHVGLRMGEAEKVDPTLAAVLKRRPRTVGEYIRDDRSTWMH
jgi:hypothetical protein